MLVNNLHLKKLEQDRWPGTFFSVMPDVKPPSIENENVFCKIYVVKTFDLIGACGPSLLAKSSLLHAESVHTINQLLTEMDGFEDNTGVVVMAATNRPAALDTALTRPGRFDRIVHLPLPNVDVRAFLALPCLAFPLLSFPFLSLPCPALPFLS